MCMLRLLSLSPVTWSCAIVFVSNLSLAQGSGASASESRRGDSSQDTIEQSSAAATPADASAAISAPHPEDSAAADVAGDEAVSDTDASGDVGETQKRAPSSAQASRRPRKRTDDEVIGELDDEEGDPSSPVVEKAVLDADATVLTKKQSPGEQDRRASEKPATRWSEVGPFVGVAVRSSSSRDFKYKAGFVYGGFFRPQITDYLAVRLSYREERIFVVAMPGAFDYGDETHALDLEQPNLKVTSLGVRIEPSLPLTRHIHFVGVLSWSWARFVVPMPKAEGFSQRADRSAVELDWGIGGGFGIDLLHNWLNLSLIGAYHFVTNQTGSAFDDSTQAIVDGQMTRFAPLPGPKNLVDVLFSIGLIL